MSLPVLDPALSLPRPEAVETLSSDALYAAWVAKFLELRTDYDVERLESDPGPVVAQAMSFMRMLDRARINDAYSALRLARATFANLDGLAADRGVRRLVYAPADPLAGTAAVMEPDESLRLRTWLRMQAWGLGSPFGIEYAARTVGGGDLADARCYDFPGTGRMRVVLLPAPGRAEEFAPVLARIAAHVMDRRRRPGAGVIDCLVATIRRIDVSGTRFVRRGLSDASERETGRTAIAAYLDERRRIGSPVRHARLIAAACLGGAVDARLTPSTDIAIGPEEAAEAGSIDLRIEAADD